MAASKFTQEYRDALIELLADGFTLTDACSAADVSLKTVKGWITRGNREGDGAYFDFAERVREARLDASEREKPMDEAELKLVASRSARKGNVQAMKLLWEMIRADGDEDPEDDEHGFGVLDGAPADELAKRRAAAGSTA